MKVLKLIFAILLCITFSCENNKKEKVEEQTTETAAQVQTINKKVDPATFKEKIENKDVQLVDVRTPDEFAQGHIQNARNINVYQDDFLEQVNAFDKSKPVYVYCKSGSRSGLAANKLEANGFTQVYNLKGGFLAWKKENFKIEK